MFKGFKVYLNTGFTLYTVLGQIALLISVNLDKTAAEQPDQGQCSLQESIFGKFTRAI